MSTLRKTSVTFADKNNPAEHDIDLYRHQLESTLNRTKSILKNKDGHSFENKQTTSYKKNGPTTEFLDSKVKGIANSINSLKKYDSSAKVSRDIVNASAMTNCCTCECSEENSNSCEWVKKVEKLKLKNRVLKDRLTEGDGKIASLEAQISLKKVGALEETHQSSHLQNEIHRMESLIEELEASKYKNQDCELLKLLRTELQSKKSLLVKVSKKLKKKKKDLSELKEALKELVLKSQITEQRAGEFEISNKRLKKGNRDLKDERDRMKDLLINLEMRIKELEFQLAKCTDTDELLTKVDILKEKCRATKLAKEKIKDKCELQIGDLNEKISWLNSKNWEISAELAASRSEKDALARTIIPPLPPQIQVKEVIVEKPVVVEKPIYIEVEQPIGIQETREVKISNEYYEEQLSRLRQELSHVTYLFNEKERENLSLKSRITSMQDDLHRWRQY